MFSLKFFSSCILALVCLPVIAADGTKITNNEFTCNLPEGWHKINSPHALITATPFPNNGRFFIVVVESGGGCPTPRQIDDESDYEKGYWGKFDSNFEASAHCHITNRDFQIIDGIPFRIIDAVREAATGANENFYLEEASTPGNGNIYELLSVRKGDLPENDPDLQALMQSFSFLKPPHFPWYQPLLHETSNISGAPLFLVALGMGIYLLTIRQRNDVSQLRKINIASTAMCLALINGYWLAGLNSWVGIASFVLMGGFVLLLQPLIKERRALIAEGKIVGPSSKKLKTKFWILIGACLLGVVIADVQLAYTGMSLLFMTTVDVLTIGIIGLIFWFQRRNFFPKSDSINEPKS